MVSNTFDAQSWCGVKISRYGSFHELSLATYENSSTQWVIKKKRLINQPTIAFVGEQNYKWPHIDDGILDN